MNHHNHALKVVATLSLLHLRVTHVLSNKSMINICSNSFDIPSSIQCDEISVTDQLNVHSKS